MTALSDWDIVSDAELARAAAAGDRRAFAMIYDRYADRLHDFCVGMVRDRDAAADCVQDVFCAAATQLPQLRDPDKLRPWLYAIARNEALRCIRDRRREQVSDDLPEVASLEAGPDTLAARSELAGLIAQAAGGLSDRDRTVLELAYRHGLDGPELAEALEVSPGNANRMVSRLRNTIATSLGALLVARRAQRTANACAELSAMLSDWDGAFSVLMRKRISRHIESCPTCEEERRRLVSPVALLGAVPVFIPAPSELRDHTLNQIRLTAADGTLVTSNTAVNSRVPDSAYPSSAASSSDAAGPDEQGYFADRPGRTRQLIPWIAVCAAAVFLAAMLTIALLYHHTTAVTPTELSGNMPVPMKPAAPPSAGTIGTVPPPAEPPAAPPANTTAPEVIVPPGETPAPIQTPLPTPPIGTVPPPAAPPPVVPPPLAPPTVLLPPPVVVPPPVSLPALPPPVVAPPVLPTPPKVSIPAPPTFRPPAQPSPPPRSSTRAPTPAIK